MSCRRGCASYSGRWRHTIEWAPVCFERVHRTSIGLTRAEPTVVASGLTPLLEVGNTKEEHTPPLVIYSGQAEFFLTSLFRNALTLGSRNAHLSAILAPTRAASCTWW